jgi:DNA-binding IscR family transcriptional regulator
VENPKVCKLQADCLTRPVWQGVSRLLKDHLSSLTLQDVLEGKKLPA